MLWCTIIAFKSAVECLALHSKESQRRKHFEIWALKAHLVTLKCIFSELICSKMSNDWICWSQSATIHSSSYGERGKREKEWSLMPIWFNIRSKYSSSFLVLYRLCSFHRTVYTFHYISFVCSPSSLHIHTHFCFFTASHLLWIFRSHTIRCILL